MKAFILYFLKWISFWGAIILAIIWFVNTYQPPVLPL